MIVLLVIVFVSLSYCIRRQTNNPDPIQNKSLCQNMIVLLVIMSYCIKRHTHNPDPISSFVGPLVSSLSKIVGLLV